MKKLSACGEGMNNLYGITAPEGGSGGLGNNGERQ